MQARVLIIDDHPVFRRGLRDLLEEAGDLVVCGEAASAPEGLRCLRSTTVDLATVDISLRDGHGIELTKQIAAEFPRTKVLVVSMYEESLFAERVLRAGASGYVNKQDALDSIVEAVRQVLAGSVFLSAKATEQVLDRAFGHSRKRDPSSLDILSDREVEVFQWIGEGLVSREIAGKLKLSVKTVNAHRQNIKRKLGFRRASELNRAAVANSLRSW